MSTLADHHLERSWHAVPQILEIVSAEAMAPSSLMAVVNLRKEEMFLPLQHDLHWAPTFFNMVKIWAVARPVHHLKGLLI
jgi:hypothetical protein